MRVYGYPWHQIIKYAIGPDPVDVSSGIESKNENFVYREVGFFDIFNPLCMYILVKLFIFNQFYFGIILD